MQKIGEVVSRLKNKIKAVKQDAFVTDRFIHSLVMKYSKLYMRRQDSQNKIMKFNSLFQTIDFLELEEIDPVQAHCKCVSSDCRFKRTKDKLPPIVEGYWGPIIRSVTSLDISQELEYTFPTVYEKIARQKNAKYNKKKYYWYMDGHLYFPNLEWDAVKIEALFEGETFGSCQPKPCIKEQDKQVYIPEFLFAEIEQNVLNDLRFKLGIPIDPEHDTKHVAR
jgi:hypothetical protein